MGYRKMGMIRLTGFLISSFLCSTVIAATQETVYYMVVARDGSGDFINIQDALDHTKAFPDKRITIFIKNGVYHEKVKIYSWNTNVTLKGESKERTIISYDDYFDKIGKGRNSTFHTYTMLVEGNDFIGENLTIENTAGSVGQAIALAVIADRSVFRNCRITGHQDTLYLAGEGMKQYFYQCEIEGTTDFIFGEATAVFDYCEIHAKADSYITAASTPENFAYGFVFFNCRITADKEVNHVYLGRPWRPYAKTIYIGCTMGDFIRPEGWDNWSKSEAEKTTFYAEYDCSGKGYIPSKRVTWSHQLSKEEGNRITPAVIYSTTNNLKYKDWYKRKAD